MKKIKSPWYGFAWLSIWTVAIIWFVLSGRFNTTEIIGLVIVWLTLSGVTIYLLIKHYIAIRRVRDKQPVAKPPSLNGPCPCGSGLKYKRCCAPRVSP
jgi:hypothetical protein